jgi:hypothetical protein
MNAFSSVRQCTKNLFYLLNLMMERILALIYGDEKMWSRSIPKIRVRPDQCD